MTTISHPVLGRIDTSAPGHWEGTRTLLGRRVTIDLTLEEANASPAIINAALQLSEDARLLDEEARAALASDLEEGDDAVSVIYVNNQLSELSDEELSNLFDDDPENVDPEEFLEKMQLVRLGIYPEETERHVLLDYSIGSDLTTYVLSVAFDRTGQVTGITMES